MSRSDETCARLVRENKGLRASCQHMRHALSSGTRIHQHFRVVLLRCMCRRVVSVGPECLVVLQQASDPSLMSASLRRKLVGMEALYHVLGHLSSVMLGAIHAGVAVLLEAWRHEREHHSSSREGDGDARRIAGLARPQPHSWTRTPMG